MDKLTAYKIVIDDIAQDIGWIDGAQDDFIQKLKHRVYELTEVLGVTKPKYEVFKEKLWVAEDGSWGSCDILVADVGTWTDAQLDAFDDIANQDDPTIEQVIDIVNKESN